MEAILDRIAVTQYNAYKDSGEGWIGAIPKHWELKKIKRLFFEIRKRSNPDLPCGAISFGKVVYKDDEKIPETTKKSYQVVCKGDFLVNPLNLNYDLKSLRIALSELDVVVSSGYIVLGISEDTDRNYFKWLLHRFDVAFMKTLGSGVRQTLSFTDIGECVLPIPPLPEQTAIANFLDQKTALIDKAIAIKEKQIELLKEHRQILIHKAVTRGLNPNVKMRNSGVEWIGAVPEHWKVVRLKNVCSINLETLPEDTLAALEFDYVDIGSVNMDQGIVQVERVKFKDAPSRARRLAKNGDTVISTVRTYLKAIDFIDESKSHFVYSTGFAVLHPKESYIPKFLTHFVRSDAFTEQVSVYSKGMSYPAISSSELGSLAVVECSLDEQRVISDYVELVTSQIVLATSQKRLEIEKLIEYKATLINSTVTGKIKACCDA